MDWILHCIEQLANQVSGRTVGIIMLVVILALAAWLWFRGIETA